MKDLTQEPISGMQWIHISELKPNDYNPNHVAPKEFELLKISIMEDGWTQPIVALPDKTIVDGFHRYTVSHDDDMQALYGGMVPVVTCDFDEAHRQMSTIRHNRARGSHGVLHMAKIIRGMIDDGLSQEEIEKRLGMEDEEVLRLNNRAGSPDTAHGKDAEGKASFGKAWVPEGD